MKIHQVPCHNQLGDTVLTSDAIAIQLNQKKNLIKTITQITIGFGKITFGKFLPIKSNKLKVVRISTLYQSYCNPSTLVAVTTPGNTANVIK